MTSPRRNVSIEECLFGPARTCPSDIWDAVLGGITAKPGSNPLDATTTTTLAAPAPAAPSRLLEDDLGIDDLEDRWARPEKVYPNHAIPLQELRRLASQGISEQYRGVAWRVLLGGLPLDLSEWKQFLITRRMEYRQLVADLFADPHHDGNDLRGHHGKKKQQAQAKRDYEMKKGTPNATPKTKNRPISTSIIDGLNKELIHQLVLSDESTAEGHEVKNDADEPDGTLSTQNADNATPPSNATDDNQQLETSDTKVPAPADADSDHALVELPLKDEEDHSSLEQQNSKDHDDEETISCGSLADMVPMHIQEEWKKTGRDITTLDNMQNGQDVMNTLLLSPDSQARSDALVSISEDPHSLDSDSKWFQFFDNASLLDEIRKDVVRTHPELYFFLEPENNLGQRRYAALERILFVWAKLNRGVRYVQGMNEIVGTIYYVLANDDSEVWACEAEADTYFLFNSLMVEMRDVFVAELDEADTGIQGRISNMTALLSLHDPEVRCHLVDIGIDPAFFAIRWLTTLLSREFLLPDTIRLWDSMFASTHKDNFIRYVCVTMVMIIRNKLLKGDFSTCLRLLQAYPTTNIDGLLEASRALWIYESQVTLACHKGGISLHQALCTITPPPSIVMAYGLPGGVARPRSSAGEEAAPPSSRGFFSRAQNAVLGQIGAGVRSMNNRGRTQSYDGPTSNSSNNSRP